MEYFQRQEMHQEAMVLSREDKWMGMCVWLPRWLSGKESSCQRRKPKRHRFSPWIEKIPWRREQEFTPVFLPAKSHGQRSLVGYSSWGPKNSDMTEHAHIYIYMYILIHNFIRYTRKMKLAENTAFMQVSTLRNLWRLFLRHDNSQCFYYY